MKFVNRNTTLNYNMHTYAFNCFHDVILQIQIIQKEMECLFLDLEDAYDETDPQARREALARVEQRFQAARDRRRTLAIALEDDQNDLVPLSFLNSAAPFDRTKKELP